MAIKSVEDLHVNVDYFLCTGKDLKGKLYKPKRARLLGIIQEFERSEFHMCNLVKGSKPNWATGTFGIHESGIGRTEKEAIENYGKIADKKLLGSYKSLESISTDLKELEYERRKYFVYNCRYSMFRVSF